MVVQVGPGPVTARQRRRDELDGEVRRLFVESGRCYGSPRIYQDLFEAGVAVSVKHRRGLDAQTRPART